MLRLRRNCARNARRKRTTTEAGVIIGESRQGGTKERVKSNARKASRNRSCRTHVKLSQKALERTGAPLPPFCRSPQFGHRGVQADWRHSGTRRRTHKELLRHQEKSVSEYCQFISNPVDVTEIAEEAQRRVKDRPLQEAPRVEHFAKPYQRCTRQEGRGKDMPRAPSVGTIRVTENERARSRCGTSAKCTCRFH